MYSATTIIMTQLTGSELWLPCRETWLLAWTAKFRGVSHRTEPYSNSLRGTKYSSSGGTRLKKHLINVISIIPDIVSLSAIHWRLWKTRTSTTGSIDSNWHEASRRPWIRQRNFRSIYLQRIWKQQKMMD